MDTSTNRFIRTVRRLAAGLVALVAVVLALTGCDKVVAGTALRGVIAPSHHVIYTLTAQDDTQVTIIYLTTEPSSETAFKKAPYDYLSLTTVTIGPNKPWTYGRLLNDPDAWAFVHASINGEVRAKLHCGMSVDEVEVVDLDGENNVQCPIRDW